jgi:hypothetical protein
MNLFGSKVDDIETTEVLVDASKKVGVDENRECGEKSRHRNAGQKQFIRNVARF